MDAERPNRLRKDDAVVRGGIAFVQSLTSCHKIHSESGAWTRSVRAVCARMTQWLGEE